MESVVSKTENEAMKPQNNKRGGRKKIKLKKYHCKDGWSQIHRIGLCRQSLQEESGINESKSHRWFRLGILIAIGIFIIKNFLLLLIYHNQEDEDIIDENMFQLFGDFFFFEPKIRKHFIVVILFALIRPLQTQLLYYLRWRSGRMRCIPSVNLFQVFAGMRSSKELGLGWQDVIKLMKR